MRLAHQHIEANFPVKKHNQMKEHLLTTRAVELVAMKVDKLSGDLRHAFNILRKTLEHKLQSALDTLSVTYEDINRVVSEMY